MSKSVAIVGAGIQGLLVARELLTSGWDICVHERLPRDQHFQATSYAAGGMLAPFSELESAENLISQWGLEALELWPAIVPRGVFFRREGSLILSHARDLPYFQALTQRIVQQTPTGAWQWARVLELEPELGHTFERGLFLPGEAHLDNRALLPALVASLEAGGVRFRFGDEISDPHALSADRIIDCRGISAQKDEPELRGVRGEAALLHAPDVTLRRPVRLMHPRYAVYIVPRANQTYYLGATSIEGGSDSPVTVRSALELLSAAFSVHGGFAEATIVELLQGIRPAYPDHFPRLIVRGRVIVINGLYRHGFLLSPVLAKRLRLFLEDRPVPHAEHLFHFA